MSNKCFKPAALITTGLCLCISYGCSRSGTKSEPSSVEASSTTAEPKMENRKAEAKSAETNSVEPQVQSEIEKMEAEKHATLLQDAQTALADTRKALAALDKGDKQGALEALEQATGKLDLVVSRDPKLAVAPVAVETTIFDLYAAPDTVKTVVNAAKDDLASERVQSARHLVSYLASEADVNVSALPLATYPAAIKAVAPLIDAGKTEEAKAALESVLDTLVIETYVVPLPRARAEALLAEAQKLASRSNKTQDDNKRLHNLLDATRTQIQLAEALGYGTKDSYKPLYSELDEVQRKAASGQSGGNLFDRLRQSIRNFKFSV